MFETVTPGISGYTAQAEPTAAAIAKRFSALAPFDGSPRCNVAEAARVHHATRRRSGRVAGRGAGAEQQIGH